MTDKAPTREEVELGWKALHMKPGKPDKHRRKEFCSCEPETNQVPCEYCALYEALRAADRLLDENERLKADLAKYDDACPYDFDDEKCMAHQRRALKVVEAAKTYRDDLTVENWEKLIEALA